MPHATAHCHMGTSRRSKPHLKAEVQELLALAEQADLVEVPDGVSLPAEIKRREDRLAAMEEARVKIAARAQERFEHEQAVYAAKMVQREKKAEKTGKKPGGKPPQPLAAGIQATDQINLADEESRIIPVSGGGFEQAYNAQAAVDAGSLLVVATAVTQATNDKEQVEPMLEQLAALPQSLGKVDQLLADSGFYSSKNVVVCEEAGIKALIAVARDEHHPGWRECFTEPAPLSETATAAERMAHRLKTRPDGPRMRSGNKRWSRCLASLNPSWAFASFSCADCTRLQPNGIWCAWPGI